MTDRHFLDHRDGRFIRDRAADLGLCIVRRRDGVYPWLVLRGDLHGPLTRYATTRELIGALL
jgi:hypothetical protein